MSNSPSVLATEMHDGETLNSVWELVSLTQGRGAENKTSLVTKNIQQKPGE